MPARGVARETTKESEPPAELALFPSVSAIAHRREETVWRSPTPQAAAIVLDTGLVPKFRPIPVAASS